MYVFFSYCQISTILINYNIIINYLYEKCYLLAIVIYCINYD